MNRKERLKVLGYRKLRMQKIIINNRLDLVMVTFQTTSYLPRKVSFFSLLSFRQKYSVAKQCCYSNWSTYCDERKFFFYKNHIQQRRCETHVYEHNQKHFTKKEWYRNILLKYLFNIYLDLLDSMNWKRIAFEKLITIVKLETN